MTIPLGPFTLHHPVGRGGMGVVWLGRHEAQGVPVAVKVITANAAHTEEYHRAFHQEVRAVSSLDHPGVVWIFDYGTIDAASAAASNGELVQGSPYLVMEYASRGTLRQLERMPTWPECRAILMTLLDALAHAHARGVLHRDLKPDNVLIAGGEDLRPGIKITDFGIARPLDETAVGDSKPVGTPQYMAPEQIRNDVDATGPHTDLYALGTLAWRLVSGRLPFQGAKGAALLYAQLNRPPGPLDPIMAVPDGLETLLRTMLAKEPCDRYRCAADAALALASLPDIPDPAFHGSIRLAGGARPDEIDLDTATLKILLAPDRPLPSLAALGADVCPPFPSTWRLPPTANRPLRLLGAGLGLFGVRPVPMVGREAERDLLWKALFDVHHERRAQVVVVRGEAGVGKTRLTQWIAERAHEVGGATVLKVAFTTPETALEHLGRSLVRLLRSSPASPEQRATRFRPLFTAFGLEDVPVADAVEIALDPDRTPMPEPHRHALIRRIWETLALDRPLLVVVDDVQWGLDAVRLARHLLESQDGRPSRILMLLAVPDDAAGAVTELARLLDGLLQRRGARQIPLLPLPQEQREELVQEILGIEAGLATTVAERTAGNPLFAVQLIGDWVDRKQLAAGPDGFVLGTPAPPVPRSLAEVWDGRIRGLVAGLEPPALELLERAAVLGREVDVLEWQAVGDDAEGRHAATGRAYFKPKHARLRQALMERLLVKQLAISTERGFVFGHASFRDAVLARAENAGRIRGHARAAAAVLVHSMSDRDAERVGRLLAESGRIEEALDAFFRAEAFRRRTTGMAAALDLLVEVEQVLRTHRVPTSKRGWAELAARRASALAAVGRPAEASRAARTAMRLATGGGWAEIAALAASVLGMVAASRDDAEQHWLEVVRLLGADPDPAQLATAARAWHRLRRIAVARGDAALARARGESMAALLPRAESDEDRALILGAIAEWAWAEGRLVDAGAAATEASELAGRHGDLAAEAKARSILAEVAEAEARLPEARDEWSRVVDLLDAYGARHHATLSRCRLGLTLCQLGDYATARDVGERILADGEPAEPRLRAAVHGLLALTAAGRARWERFDAHLRVCEALFPTLPTVHNREYAMAMIQAADCALERHQRDRALRALALAELRARAVGDAARLEAIRARIEVVKALPS